MARTYCNTLSHEKDERIGSTFIYGQDVLLIVLESRKRANGLWPKQNSIQADRDHDVDGATLLGRMI